MGMSIHQAPAATLAPQRHNKMKPGPALRDSVETDAGYVDRVIVLLMGRVRAAEAQRDAYREIACTALESQHDLVAKVDRQREQLARLRDEYRALRVQSLSRAAA